MNGIKAVLSSEPFYDLKASNKRATAIRLLSDACFIMVYCIYVLSCMVYSEWTPTTSNDGTIHRTGGDGVLAFYDTQYGIYAYTVCAEVLEISQIGALFFDRGLIQS